jgi:pimeloyl-ACP methyl ester carboxylesterase
MSTMIDPDSFTSYTVRANGQRIHLVEAGEGPLVLLLHGFPESWYSWRHQLVALREAGYRAVAMTGRGYGRSSKPPDMAAYRVTELVADCVDVVRALGESSAAVVGHDWGAQVAWTAAWTRPDVFTAVAGLSVPFGGRGLTGLPGRDERPSDVGRAISGPELMFYMDYIAKPGAAEREIEADLDQWLRDGYYSYSESPPLPPALESVDLGALDEEAIVELLRQAATCMTPGARWRDRFLQTPEVFPDWLSEDELAYQSRELEYSGLTGPLNWYRCLVLQR